MSTTRALLLAGLVFLITLLARLPARLLLPLLPAGDELPGSDWDRLARRL